MREKKWNRRDFLRITAVTTVGALAAACVPATPPAAKEAVQPAPKEKVTIKFMVPGTPTEDADFKPVFDEFAKRYPDINAVYAPAGTGYGPQYLDKLLTMLAGGTVPDVFKSLNEFFGSLAEMGVYVPLDDYVAVYPEITYFDDFFDAHIEACRYKGQLLALPNDGAPNGMWYNVDLFKQEGLDLPNWDWTWDDLLSAAKTLTKEEKGITTQYGVGHPPWLVWVWSNGGRLLNQEGTKCLLDSPEAIEALTWMQDLVVKHKVSPGPEALSELSESERFQTGRLGAYFCVRGCLGALRSIQDFFFDAAPMPKSNKGKRLTTLAIGYTSIWEGSKHPDEAYKLTAWICSPEGQRLRISRGFAHPSRKSLVEEDWYKEYTCPKCASYNVNTVFPEMLKRGEAKVPPAHPRIAEIYQAIDTQLDYLWDGSKPAAQVAQDMTTEVDKILQRWLTDRG